jgi:hypothetical protein
VAGTDHLQVKALNLPELPDRAELQLSSVLVNSSSSSSNIKEGISREAVVDAAADAVAAEA